MASRSSFSASRFRTLTWWVLTALAFFDVVGTFVFIRISKTGTLTNGLLTLLAMLAINIALIMPLAQMWLDVERQNGSDETPTDGELVIPLSDNGMVRLSVKVRNVDLAID